MISHVFHTRVSLVVSALRALLVHLALVDFQERGVLQAYLEAREKRYLLSVLDLNTYR